MRIAVISDVHSVADTFRSALEDARRTGFDQMVILGDLFTYGVDPVECADLAIEAMERDDALLIAGNHDKLYLDLESSCSAYYDRLPEWIMESAQWTWSQLGEQWPRRLETIQEWAWDGLLLAHANPFGFGNWTYLSSPELLAEAARVLRERGFRAGIFGHLHREATYRDDLGTLVHIVDSTGQPRRKGFQRTSWTLVEVSEAEIDIETRSIPFDRARLREQIRMVPNLSHETKAKLCGFYL